MTALAVVSHIAWTVVLFMALFVLLAAAMERFGGWFLAAAFIAILLSLVSMVP